MNLNEAISIEKLLQTIGMLFFQSQVQLERIQQLEAENKKLSNATKK